MTSFAFLETLWQDVRYGARLLLRNRTFAVVAILTLALGTGANTAIFQLVNAVRLRTLPVEDPARLVEIRIVKTAHGRTGSFQGSRPSLSNPLYERIRDEQRVFSSIMAWSSTTWNLSAGGEVRPAAGMYVSGSYFETLGVQAARGRTIDAQDDVKGCAAPGAVVSDAFWRREYGADPSVVGRGIRLDGHAFDIVGVAPAYFTGVEVGRRFDVAVPVCAEAIFRGARSGLPNSDTWFLASLGRLKPGVTIEQASAQLAAISGGIFPSIVSPRYDASTAKDFAEFKLGALPAATGISGLRNAYGDPLNILLGVTAIVLVIACANLANLMLARATAREREIAVRLAIGASRRRIVRQMLTESLLLAALGAAGGLLVARWPRAFLISFLSTDGSPVFVDLAPDWRVFGFTAGVALVACVLFGLAPAVRATRTPPGVAMKTGSRTTTDGRERFGVRRALVVAQVALSLVLVVGALLFVRTLRNLTQMDPGFRQDGVLVADLDYRKAGIDASAIRSVDRRVLERLRAIPGVDSASQVNTTPVSGNFWNDRVIIGGQQQEGNVNFNAVGRSYFETMATPLVAGRDFADSDTPQSPRVAIVSESFVKKYFPGRQAVGQSFQVAAPIGEPRPMIQIVGVARDTKYADLREAFTPIAYLGITQGDEPDNQPAFAMHAATGLPAVTAAATRALAEINPAIAVRYQTVRAQVQGSLLRERLMAALSGFFGGLAVLIATVGLYGVMMLVARQRVRNRDPHGARGDARHHHPDDRGRGERPAAGRCGGRRGSGDRRGARGHALLYELTPWDPATLLLAAAALGTVTIAASCIPALRAARLEPTRALRED